MSDSFKFPLPRQMGPQRPSGPRLHTTHMSHTSEARKTASESLSCLRRAAGEGGGKGRIIWKHHFSHPLPKNGSCTLKRGGTGCSAVGGG